MTQLTLVIGNKNYSSWSLRPWLVMKQFGLEFNEVRIPLYNNLVPQGGSQKPKVKSQKYYGISSLRIFNGCSIYAVTY